MTPSLIDPSPTILFRQTLAPVNLMASSFEEAQSFAFLSLSSDGLALGQCSQRVIPCAKSSCQTLFPHLSVGARTFA